MRDKVFEYLLTIPKGKVTTYGEISKHIGNKNLARVVGNILHNNPDEEKFPCYKVVNSKGELSRNFAFGGIFAQKKKLESDGIEVINFTVDLNKYKFEDQYMCKSFPEIKKKLGFGCMRFPMLEKEVDYAELKKMIDVYMKNGFNYFDTAHGYIDGLSETALRDCLVKRYPRESYVLTNKLSTFHFKKNEEIRPLFESQLKACGVEYFDFYFMHAQSAKLYEKYTREQAYETALELMAEGKFKHFGISFHDEASLLEKILSEHPEIEFVQIQLNYIDYDDAAVQGKLCLEVCEKYNKPVIVMEPVKGGSLVNLPDKAKAVFDSLGGGSYASYAIRFAASFKNVITVLSGMSNIEQMEDNISYMKDFIPLKSYEKEAVDKVCEIFKAQDVIPCTACRYCTEVCPKHISIPDLFACMNSKKTFEGWNPGFYYNGVHTVGKGKASDCIKCGRCAEVCPQKLKIPELLCDVAREFEK